jgi:hypothetical protein
VKLSKCTKKTRVIKNYGKYMFGSFDFYHEFNKITCKSKMADKDKLIDIKKDLKALIKKIIKFNN